MRLIRCYRALRPAPRLLVPLLLLAACADGETAPVARLHELRVSIVSGRAMLDSVRDATLPAGSEQLAERVVARVYAVPDEDAGDPITEPGREVRLPPVTLQWRALQSFCEPLVTASTPGSDGTAANQVRRPTRALTCQLVVEGAVDGQVFDADTATILFKPGPVVTFRTVPVLGHFLGFGATFYRGVLNAQDAHGNYITDYDVAAELISGAPPFVIRDTLTLSPQEAAGVARLTIGQVSRDVPVWALTDLRGGWRLEWACYDLAPGGGGGAHVDSVHYRLDAEARYGPTAFTQGIVLRLEGTLATRRWERLQPVRETSTAGYVRFGAQRPGVVEWSPGEVASSVSTGYVGGSLCEPLLDGRAWGRSAPVRMTRR